MKYHVNILLEDSYRQFSVSDNLNWEIGWRNRFRNYGVYYFEHTTPSVDKFTVNDSDNIFYTETVYVDRSLIHENPTKDNHSSIVSESGIRKNKIELEIKSDYYRNGGGVVYNIHSHVSERESI